MYERVAERSIGELWRSREFPVLTITKVLDDRIDEFAEIVREHYLLEDIQGPTETSEVCPFLPLEGFSGSSNAKEEAVIVGRICTDVETEQAEGKLHEGVLYLETSRMIDAGIRGLIRFNPNLKIRAARPGTSSVGFFPGSIAAFKGQNATGDWFQVSEVLSVSSHSRLYGFKPTVSVTLTVASPPQSKQRTSQTILDYGHSGRPVHLRLGS